MCEVVKCENVYCVIQTIQCVPFSEYPKKTSRKLFDSSKRYVPASSFSQHIERGFECRKKSRMLCCIWVLWISRSEPRIPAQRFFFLSRKLLADFVLFFCLLSSSPSLIERGFECKKKSRIMCFRWVLWISRSEPRIPAQRDFFFLSEASFFLSLSLSLLVGFTSLSLYRKPYNIHHHTDTFHIKSNQINKTWRQ